MIEYSESVRIRITGGQYNFSVILTIYIGHASWYISYRPLKLVLYNNNKLCISTFYYYCQCQHDIINQLITSGHSNELMPPIHSVVLEWRSMRIGGMIKKIIVNWPKHRGRTRPTLEVGTLR